MVWCQLWYGSPHFSVERLRCRLKRGLSGTVSDHFYVITSKPQEPREELCSKRHGSIAGLIVILRFAHTDTHLPSHQELSTNDSHNHSIYRQWPLQAQRLEPLGSGCNIGAINSVVPVKNIHFYCSAPQEGKKRREKAQREERWWGDEEIKWEGMGKEGRRANPWSITFPTQPHNLCSERQREEERERRPENWEEWRSKNITLLSFLLRCSEEQPQCEPLNKRENLLFHPSIHPSRL